MPMDSRNRPPGPGRGSPGGSAAAQTQEFRPRGVTYFDGQGKDAPIRTALLDQEAQELAREIRNMAKTQLRRYYNDVLSLQHRLELMTERLGGPAYREEAFRQLRAEFLMLKAKAHYAYSRSSKTFPEKLLQFFVDHTNAVKTARDFDAFCRHFQAVVGFHHYYGKEEERE